MNLSKLMSASFEERRIRGIARQIGILKCELRRERRRNMMFFLLGMTLGLIMNIVLKLLGL